MAVLIGHASIGSNGKAKNDVAGDNNGKEVCTRNWYQYSSGWNVLLRPKSQALAEKSAINVERGCSNNKIGYDQNQRNTLWTQAKKVGNLANITVACETDCSAFMTVCAILGGANISYGTNAPTTRTMRKIFKASGQYDVITDKKYLTSSDYLKRGDILVAEGHHTVMVLSNGSKANSGSTSPTKPISGKSIILPTGVLKKGAKGENVLNLQKAINVIAGEKKIAEDGDYGNNTKKAVEDVQKVINMYMVLGKIIDEDGIYGSDTRKGMTKSAETQGITVL